VKEKRSEKCLFNREDKTPKRTYLERRLSLGRTKTVLQDMLVGFKETGIEQASRRRDHVRVSKMKSRGFEAVCKRDYKIMIIELRKYNPAKVLLIGCRM